MKSGFVTIIGRPNVGKSSFLNKVVGSKIAIMSDKPQTTRNVIKGIFTNDEMQAIFIDTPGIHAPHHELGHKMVSAAFKSINGVDICIYMISATDHIREFEEIIAKELKKTKMPVFLVINKIDLIRGKQAVDKVILEFRKLYDFAAVFPISVLLGTNVDRLLDSIKDSFPEGPQYYPKDQVTDQTERFIIAELIREKVILLTREEVPHSVAVTEILFQDKGSSLDIMATIIVERESQKGIIIGKGGSMLKEIGTQARKDIVRMLGIKIHLELWVKVKKDWRNKANEVNTFGYQK